MRLGLSSFDVFGLAVVIVALALIAVCLVGAS